MLGWKLFLRAVTLIVDNLGAALRISALPYGLAAAASLWVAFRYPDMVDMTAFDPADPPPAGFLLAMSLVFVVNVAASLWIAVGWHRYVLLAETPEGWLPALRGSLMLGYLGRSLLVGLIVALAVIVVITMLSVLLLPLFGNGAYPFIVALGFCTGLALFYRLGIVLPGGATGRSLTLAEALEATRGHTGTAAALALLTLGASFLLQTPTLIDGGRGAITVIYEQVIGWIVLMLGVGTLTAIYGHLVEGRPVD